MKLKTQSSLLIATVCLVFQFGFQSVSEAQSDYFQRRNVTPIKWIQVQQQELKSLAPPVPSDPVIQPAEEEAGANNESTDEAKVADEQSIRSITFLNPFGTHYSESQLPGSGSEMNLVDGHSANYGASIKLVSQVPTGLCHDRLFFEEVLLERHGYSRRPASAEFASAKRFLSTATVMPFTRSGRRALRGKRGKLGKR